MLTNTVYSFFTNLTYKISNVIIFIIISQIRGSSQAGSFAIALTYFIIINSLSTGFDELFLRQIITSNMSIKKLITKSILLKSAYSIISFFITVVLMNSLKYDQETKMLIIFFCISIVFEGMITLFQSVLYSKNDFKTSFLIVLFMSLLRLIGSVYIIVNGYKLTNIGIIWIVGGFFGVTISIYHIYQIFKLPDLKASIDNSIYSILNNAIPFLKLTILNTLEFQIDIILLSIFRPLNETGYYNALTSIYSFLILISQTFRFVIYPIMVKSSTISLDIVKNVYIKTYYLLLGIALPISFGIAVLSKNVVLLLFGQEFNPAVIPLKIIVFAIIPQFLNVDNTRFLYSLNLENKLVKINFFSMILNLTINLILIPLIGIFGCVLARVASTTFYYLLTYLLINKKSFIRSSFSTVLKIILASAIMGFFVFFLNKTIVISLFLSTMIGFIIYISVLIVFRLLNKQNLISFFELMDR